MKAKKTGLIIAIAASVAVIAGAVAAAVLFIKPASEPEPTAASDEVTQAADEQVHENIDGIDWYDPSGSEFVLTDADMLYDLQTLSYHYDFAGQTIKLGADIIVNRGDCAAWKENAPERSWSPIRGFAGTFDGCGHTISGLYANTQNEPLALFSGAETGAIIRDFRLENSLFINFGSVGTASIASASGGTYERIYSNVVLINEFGQAGGLFSRQKGRIVASECWFDGSITSGYRRIGGIADWADGDEMVLDHCLSTGSLTCTWPSAASHLGGLVGSVMNSARLVINDCFSGGRISVRNLYSTGSVLGYTDSASNATIINTFCTLEQCEFPVSLQAANVTGGPVPIVEKDLAGIGAYKWTDLDFENYWACAESSMPVLKCFAKAPLDTAGVEKAVAYDWYDDMKDEFVITTIPELYAFALMSYNTDYAGKTVKLAADLTLNEGDPHDWIKAAPELRWYPVNNFAGIFDGQSHSISGVYVFGENAQGFFGRTKGTAFIKNFSLKDSLIHSRGKSLLNTDLSLSGAIVGRGGGMLDGVYTNAVVYGEGSQIGGMFGQINLSGMITTINNCWFDGELIEPDPEIGYMAGGLIGGLALGTVNISHCLVSGTITTSVNKGSMAGGFVGLTMNDAILNISDSLFTGKLDTANPYYVGGTIGVVRGKNKVTINKCYARYGSMQDAQGEYVSLNISVASAQVSGGAAPVIERYLKGTKAYQWTELNFDRYWSVREDDYPVPSVFYRGDAVSTDGLERLVSTEWYDPEAESLTISSRKDFIGFIMLSYGTDFAGKTVELGSSIKLSSDPYNRTVQLMPIDNFAGTFDGHGRTISGLYQHGKNLMGLFRRTDKTAVVKNLRLTNSFIEVDGYGKNRLAYAGAISAQGGGTFRNIYTDAYILSHGYGTGGMFGRFNIEKTTNRLSSLWFDGMLEADDPEYGYVCGGLVAQLLLGKTEISHCLFSGTIKTAVANKGSKVGGLVGWAWNQSEAVVNDCLSAGKLVCNNNYYKGAVLGTLYAKNPFTIKNTFAESTVALDNSGKFISAATHADAVNGELSGQAIPVIKERLIGINGYKWTTLDFDNYWTAREGACPAPKSLAGSGLSTASAERMIDTSWYSQDKKEYTIDSVKALMGFQMLSFADSFAGKTVKLGADINMNPGWTAGSKAPENGFTPIENFAGTFDGQGHTLSGVYVDGGSGTGVGLIKALRGGTVKDLKLTNSYIKGSGVDIAAVAGQSYGGTFERVYTDAVIETASSAGIGGILGTARGENTVTMRECQFDGRIKCTVEESGGRLGGLCATVVNSGTVLNAENCLVSGRIEANMNMTIGGITALSFQSGATVNAKDVLISGTIDAPNSGQVASIVGNSNNIVLNLTDVYATSESAPKTIGAGAAASGAAIVKAAAEFTGTDGYVNTLLDFTEKPYWAAVENATPALVAFFDGTALDLTGVERPAGPGTEPGGEPGTEPGTDPGTDPGTEPGTDPGTETDTDLKITNAEELSAFAEASRTDDFAGKKITLEADIDMDGVTDFPMICAETEFKGSFDGKGHTIKNFSITRTEMYAGLFRIISTGAEVKNLTIEDSAFDGTEQVGALAGLIFRDAVISGITVADSVTVNGSRWGVGGLAGRVGHNVQIKKCTVNASVAASMHSAGGIAGAADLAGDPGISIIDCRVGATVSAEGKQCVGGIVGRMHVNVDPTLTITGCTFSGTVNGGAYAGGIVGTKINAGTSDKMLTITKCVMSGSVTGTIGAGGITGRNFSPMNISQCEVTGTVTSTSDSTAANDIGTGGILGRFQNDYNVTVSDCYVSGTITSANGRSGGIAGFACAHSVTLKVEGSVFVGTAGKAGTFCSGGIIGQINNTTNMTLDIEDCISVGSVAGGNAGYVIGVCSTANPIRLNRIYTQSGKAKWAIMNGVVTETEAGTVEIDNAVEFLNVSKASSKTSYPDAVLKLTADIDMNPGWTAGEADEAPQVVWPMIGSDTSQFAKAEFDGQGHTISGIYVSETGYAGLFGVLNNGSGLHDFTLTNSRIATSGNAAGAVAGRLLGNSNVSGVNVTDSVYVILSAGGTRSGGITGFVNGAVIENCQVAAVIKGASDSGGIAGIVLGGTDTIRNCGFSGTISTNGNSGGIVGVVENYASTALAVKGCHGNGTVTGNLCGYAIGKVNGGAVTVTDTDGTSASAEVGKWPD